jgi:glycerophosphoryl diester phosphodiesterase
VTRWFDAAAPRVLAHRGLALRAPENTAAAFAAARDAGAQYLETDVRLTRDRVAVLAHDATFRAADGRVGEIRRSSMDELREVDLGGGVGFTSLEDALDAFPLRWNIDVKADEAVTAAVEVLGRVGAIDRVLLASFSERRRVRLVRALPGVATSLGIGGVARVLAASRTGSVAAVRAALAGADAVQVPERARGLRVVTPRLVRAVHAAGAEVHVWTVNEPADMRRLLDLGVDGLVTDRTDLALEAVRER